jgi:hypothetical protein
LFSKPSNIGVRFLNPEVSHSPTAFWASQTLTPITFFATIAKPAPPGPTHPDNPGSVVEEDFSPFQIKTPGLVWGQVFRKVNDGKPGDVTDAVGHPGTVFEPLKGEVAIREEIGENTSVIPKPIFPKGFPPKHLDNRMVKFWGEPHISVFRL